LTSIPFHLVNFTLFILRWSSTVYLPKTTFPQRLEGDKRIQTDKEIILSSKFQSVYERQRSHQLEQEWMLHDGPPYANGPVHMGHAVNKILKDITNRWKVVLGHRVHYVPGWDCHGLPIELKALQAGKSKSREKDPVKIRTMARNFALTAIESQKSEFISWGVMADWSKPYLTMNKDFVQAQLRLFHDLMSKGFIYQRFMPVYWSPSSETALAESELEYNPKVNKNRT
jgi:isoleucyl-tRNA synthetase